jgi:disulfide bond formation protein DsbB
MRCRRSKHSSVILPASTGLNARDRTLSRAGEIAVTFEASAKPLQVRETNPALAAALAITAIAVATLMGAWFFQLVLDIRPCPLCLEQRYAYYLAVPLGALLAWAAAKHAPRAVLVAGLAFLALAALANAWLGAYHAGVEWGFWPGPTECSGPVLDLGKAGSLFDNLDKVKVIRCDEVQWRFLGLSLAGYNVLISLTMAALAGWGIARSVKPA